MSRGAATVSSDAHLTEKLLAIENELAMKKLEVQSLKEQVGDFMLC